MHHSKLKRTTAPEIVVVTYAEVVWERRKSRQLWFSCARDSYSGETAREHGLKVKC